MYCFTNQIGERLQTQQSNHQYEQFTTKYIKMLISREINSQSHSKVTNYK